MNKKEKTVNGFTYQTICDVHDTIYNLAGDNLEIQELAILAKKMGKRMEARLKKYKRAIVALGFKKV